MTLFEKIMSHKIRFIKNCMFLVILHSAYNLLKQESYLAISKRKATFLLNKISPYSGKSITKHRVNFLGKIFLQRRSQEFFRAREVSWNKDINNAWKKGPGGKNFGVFGKGHFNFQKRAGDTSSPSSCAPVLIQWLCLLDLMVC